MLRSLVRKSRLAVMSSLNQVLPYLFLITKKSQTSVPHQTPQTTATSTSMKHSKAVMTTPHPPTPASVSRRHGDDGKNMKSEQSCEQRNTNSKIIIYVVFSHIFLYKVNQ